MIGDSPQVARLRTLLGELGKLMSAAGAIPERDATHPLRAGDVHARVLILSRMTAVIGEIAALAGEVDADELAGDLIVNLDQLRLALGVGRRFL